MVSMLMETKEIIKGVALNFKTSLERLVSRKFTQAMMTPTKKRLDLAGDTSIDKRQVRDS